jgi:CubicO group peptidase (beta-lactamase class C family)
MSDVACSSHDLSYLGVKSAAPDNPKSITRNLRNLPLSQPPRSKYQYCNMMFTAASYMVEVLSGENFGEYLRSRIWDPLEMMNTYHDISGVQAGNASGRLAHGYEWNEDKQCLVEIPFIEQPEGQGAGLVFSSANDYARWIRSLIKRAGPLSLAAHRELVKPRAIIDEEEEERRPFHGQPLYALGLVEESYRGRTVIEHNGDVPGFSSAMRYLPELEWGVVIFGNSGEADHLAEALYLHLVDELLCIPAPERIHREGQRQAEEPRSDPDPAKPAIKPSSPLLHYAGTYRNAGYHDILVEIKDGKLFADCSDRTFGFTLTIDHVSGDDFVAEMRDIYNGMKRAVGVNFELGLDGRGTSLGVEFEEEMKSEFIRFARVE